MKKPDSLPLNPQHGGLLGTPELSVKLKVSKDLLSWIECHPSWYKWNTQDQTLNSKQANLHIILPLPS